ncbi:DUF4278 domain-containing protein [Thermocoleostomius sinensis]|jgi:hypothetical protein|uniref:DUF4278 domain-containing protein n=1 Tax=Thermocoleostomius sinensis A174 TaxID=2016057 RepID=A0A9E9C7Q6_9CYAN|nr:DUF4278 domain-containing protein [Thermocoleostomius sinensis]WAL60604.1 DUF4278 domain-containing protein [Thermocoleostomius sinensis A174]
MELHYRGAIYHHDETPIEMTENGVVGHYRGAAVRLRRPKRPVSQPIPASLTYRGAPVHRLDVQ